MDRIDEAVEVANRVLCGYYDANTDDTKASPTDAMRAALIAGVKVLLGEPVGYIAQCELDSHANMRRVRSNYNGILWSRPTGSAGIALYAPSLGD